MNMNELKEGTIDTKMKQRGERRKKFKPSIALIITGNLRLLPKSLDAVDPLEITVGEKKSLSNVEQYRQQCSSSSSCYTPAVFSVTDFFQI